jgi:hypothetical protein
MFAAMRDSTTSAQPGASSQGILPTPERARPRSDGPAGRRDQ